MWLTDCSPFSLGGAAAHLKDSLADIYILSRLPISIAHDISAVQTAV